MKAKFPLISIIVPVYNVENYIRRCIDSLINQVYPNIEIILVNDGSSDNSGTICKEYAHIHGNIKFINKENGGLSSARNAGLEIATGDYIGFTDSDDWVTSDMYGYLYHLLSCNSAEAAQVEYELAYSDTHSLLPKKERLEIISGREQILEYYMEQTTKTGFYSVCICLFKALVARKHRFAVGRSGEDMDYKFKVLSECQIFVSSNLSKYFYYQSGESISSGVLRKKNFELYNSAEVLYRLASQESFGKIRFLGEVKRARTAFSLLSKAAFYGISDEIDKGMIKALVKEHRRNLSKLLEAPLPFSRKTTALLLAINFSLAKVLVSVYKYISKGKI